MQLFLNHLLDNNGIQWWLLILKQSNLEKKNSSHKNLSKINSTNKNDHQIHFLFVLSENKNAGNQLLTIFSQFEKKNYFKYHFLYVS